MRICIIGRTSWLLSTARHLDAEGFQIPLVVTAAGDSSYGVGIEDFRAQARGLGAKFFVWPDVSTQDIAVEARNLECDMAVSINWPVLMPPSLLASFRQGVLNAHAGDLPKYRGNACPNWAILRGEKRVALTIHQMDEGLDSGPIVLKEFLEITSATYIGDIYQWLSDVIPQSFTQAVNLIRDKAFTPFPQPADPSLALRAFPRRPSDGLVDWSRSVEEVARLVRASSHPFDGAFSFLEGGPRVSIWRAVPIASETAFLAIPGQVCLQLEGDPVIACGDGLLRLTDISIGRLPHMPSARKVLSSFRNRLTSQQSLEKVSSY